jgi:hypothetical protein
VSTPLDLSEYSPTRPKVAKVRYTHDAMIDLIVANPAISQNEIAATFGYTPSWISTVFASDAFQVRLAERKTELVDPEIQASIDERFRALVLQSMEVLRRKLESPSVDGELALGVFNAATKAAGYGVKERGPVVQQNFVVYMPKKEADAASWTAAHTPRVVEADGAATLVEEVD